MFSHVDITGITWQPRTSRENEQWLMSQKRLKLLFITTGNCLFKQLSILIWKYRSTFRTLFEQQNFVYELQPVSDIKSYCYKISHIPPVRLHCSHVMLQWLHDFVFTQLTNRIAVLRKVNLPKYFLISRLALEEWKFISIYFSFLVKFV